MRAAGTPIRLGIERVWQVSKVGFAPGEQPDGTFVLPGTPLPGAGALTHAPATSAASQLPASNNNTKRPHATLEDALKTVVAAVHTANEYAKMMGYAMPRFTSEDIRTMANTLVMQRGAANMGLLLSEPKPMALPMPPSRCARPGQASSMCTKVYTSTRARIQSEITGATKAPRFDRRLQAAEDGSRVRRRGRGKASDT